MSDLNGIRDRLRDHPECIEIELFGEKRPWLLTMYGLERAREKGVEVVPLILDLGNRIAGLFGDEEAEEIEIGSQEMAERLKELVRDEDALTLSVIVWWGLVTFDDDITLEEVQMLLTPGTLMGLVPKVLDRVNQFAEDQIEEDSELAGKETNGETMAPNSPEHESGESVSAADTNPGSTDD